MSVGRQGVAQQVVEVGIEPTGCHHPRVKTLQRAAGRIAGIGKQRFFGSFALAVQALERCPGHEYLAANLKLARIVVAGEHQGDGGNGSHILSDIVALNAIAARDGLGQPAVDIGQRDAQSVVLHLAAHLERFAGKSLTDSIVPLAHVLFAIGVGQRQHGIAMLHLPEASLEVAAHTLGRRVGIVELRMACLQVLQLVHQEVEILVANCGLVEHVVAVVVLVQLAAKLFYSLLFVHKFLSLKDNLVSH